MLQIGELSSVQKHSAKCSGKDGVATSIEENSVHVGKVCELTGLTLVFLLHPLAVHHVWEIIGCRSLIMINCHFFNSTGSIN